MSARSIGLVIVSSVVFGSMIVPDLRSSFQFVAVPAIGAILQLTKNTDHHSADDHKNKNK